MKKFTLVPVLALSILLGNCISHPESNVGSGQILTYSATTIQETSSNDGTFDSEIAITLSGDTFSSTLTAGEDYDTINLPEGLTATLTRNSDTQATLSITGQVTDQETCGTQTMSFFFAESAFESGEKPVSFEIPISVTFISPDLTFSKTEVTENTSNNGAFSSQTIIITAENGGTFYHLGAPASALDVLTPDEDYIWEDLPANVTPAITVNSSTQVTVTFAFSADPADTPLSDIKSSLKFLEPALSPGFCAGFVKQSIQFKFYRSIIMYSAGIVDGGFGGRIGADGQCALARPNLPDDYDGVKAFISVSASDEIADLNVPTTVIIESTESETIATNWADLLNGSISQSLSDASVVGAAENYWTGSLDDGSISPGETCTGWTVTTGTGTIGLSLQTDSTWLDSGAPDMCSNATTNNLLCIAFVSP